MRCLQSLAALLLLLPVSLLAEDEKPPKEAPLARPKAVDPPTPDELNGAIQRGIAFLLEDQNKNGSWGSPTKTKGLNIYAPIPGAHHAFQTATTSLVLAALLDVDGGKTEKVRKAIERGETWLFENLPHLRRATPDALYNVWGHGYAIQALVRMHKRLPDDADRQKKIEDLIRDQMDLLTRYESVDGGWGYYDFKIGSQKPATDSTSFTNAAVLVAFHEAKELGVSPPQPVVKRAIDATVRQRKPDFTYLYGEYLKWSPMAPINRPGGSLGRSQACNVALKLWGDQKITEDVVKTWLDRLFTRNGWLDNGRKRPIPHEAPFQVAGYFFYFGHYYAALCIDQLKPADRPFYQDLLAVTLMKLQEKDGSWWDYPLYAYHQPYGTAFVLLSLKHCQHGVAPAPASGAR